MDTTTTVSVENTRRAGRILQDAREAIGLTRENVAAVYDVSVTRLRQIEAGYTPRPDGTQSPSRASRELLSNLCDFYAVTKAESDEIVRLSGYKPFERPEIVYLAGLPEPWQKRILAVNDAAVADVAKSQGKPAGER